MSSSSMTTSSLSAAVVFAALARCPLMLPLRFASLLPNGQPVSLCSAVGVPSGVNAPKVTSAWMWGWKFAI